MESRKLSLSFAILLAYAKKYRSQTGAHVKDLVMEG